MIHIIGGPKGTGKTKAIIDEANALVESAKGNVVFVTDTDRYMYELHRAVKVINVKNYKVAGEKELSGFIRGLIAGNRDIEHIYLDGCARIAGKTLDEMAEFFYILDKISEDCNMKITLTCSAEISSLPPFIAKYL